MIETATHSMMCLICNQVVKTVKGNNAKQHFRRHESHSYAKLKGDSRKIYNENLKKNVRKQTACITTFAKSINSCCETSYRVAYHLGVAGKSYSDGEIVKRCLIDVVKCIHSGKKADYSSIALSRVTMQRRQYDIAQQVKLSLQAKTNKKVYLHLLLMNQQISTTPCNYLSSFVVFFQALNCVRISFPWKHWLLAPVEKTYLLQLRMPAFALDYI